MSSRSEEQPDLAARLQDLTKRLLKDPIGSMRHTSPHRLSQAILRVLLISVAGRSNAQHVFATLPEKVFLNTLLRVPIQTTIAFASTCHAMQELCLNAPQLWMIFDLTRKRARPRDKNDFDRAPDEAILRRSAPFPLRITTGVDVTRLEYLFFLRLVLTRAEFLEVFVFQDRPEARNHQQRILERFFQNLLVNNGRLYHRMPESNVQDSFFVQDHAQPQNWPAVFDILAEPSSSLKSLVLGSGTRQHWMAQHSSQSAMIPLVAPDLPLNLLGERASLHNLTLRGVALKAEMYSALSQLNRLDYQPEMYPGGILEQRIVQIVQCLPKLHTLNFVITFPIATPAAANFVIPDRPRIPDLTAGGHPSLRRVSVQVHDQRYAPEVSQRLFYAEFSAWMRAWRIPEVALSLNNRRIPSLLWEAFIKESLSPQSIAPVSPSAQDELSPTELIAMDKLLILGQVGSTPIQRLFFEHTRSHWTVERAVTARLRDLTIDSNVWTKHFDGLAPLVGALSFPQLRDLTFVISPRIDFQWQSAVPGLHDFSRNPNSSLGLSDSITSIWTAQSPPPQRFPELRNVRIVYLDRRDGFIGSEHLTWSANVLGGFIESNFIARPEAIEAAMNPDPPASIAPVPREEVPTPTCEQRETPLSSSDEPLPRAPVKLARLTLHNLSLSHIGDPFPELSFAGLWKYADEVDVEESLPRVVLQSAKVTASYDNTRTNVFELWDEGARKQGGDPHCT